MVRVSVKVVGPNGECEVSLVADSGSPYTWINHQDLTDTGVVPATFRTFRTRDGAALGRQVGEASVEVLRSRATTPVVFAQSNDTQVLGKAALVQLGLEVDEARGELRKLDVLPAYQLKNEAETPSNSP
jgi:predicted aspartyl protease